MAPDVDAVAFVVDRAREATDVIGGFKDGDLGNPSALKLGGSRQSGRPGPDDQNGIHAEEARVVNRAILRKMKLMPKLPMAATPLDAM